MRLRASTRPLRAGYTLVELLVVIAIIAILVGLTTVGVFKFLGEGDQVAARSDISQLQAAVAQFKAQFKVDYLPSRIVLAENGQYTTMDPNRTKLYADSERFLHKMFGGIVLANIDWNGNGTIDTTPFELEGEQCLVFFLGGIPSQTPGAFGCLGFSSNNRYPAAPGGDRKGPFFNFTGNRLVQGSAASGGFFGYKDAFGTNVYAYFSAYGRKNGYNRYPGLGSDCALLSVAPYQQSAVQFFNPDGFQIITAGPDGVFGTGGTAFGPASSEAAKDDLSNFADRVIGAMK